jgi:sugar/nucleoside kinase (ribokinase family)
VEFDSVLKVPADPVEIIDGTGGGDAFNAGYLLAWSKGEDQETCLHQGLRLAAQVLQVRGTRLA